MDIDGQDWDGAEQEEVPDLAADLRAREWELRKRIADLEVRAGLGGNAVIPGTGYVGTEHLLLGLIREREGIAAGVLESLGVSYDKARAQVISFLRSSSGVQFMDSVQAGERQPVLSIAVALDISVGELAASPVTG